MSKITEIAEETADAVFKLKTTYDLTIDQAIKIVEIAALSSQNDVENEICKALEKRLYHFPSQLRRHAV